MTRRGRKRRPSESRLPPRGFYRSEVAPLWAVGEDDQPVSDKAFRLWHVIRAYNWDGSGCDLTDAELGRMLNPAKPVSREWVVRLRGELRAAGLLREHNPPGGRRLLEPVALGLSGGTPPPSRAPTRGLPSTGPPGIDVKCSSQGRCEPQFTRKEEEDLSPSGESDLSSEPRHPPAGESCLREGGVGGGEMVLSQVHTNSGDGELALTPVHSNSNAKAIAAALQERGVFDAPAAHIAELMSGAGFDVERAVEVFLAQMADTEHSLALTVWRLRRGIFETASEAEARVERETRTAAWQQYTWRKNDQEDGEEEQAASGVDESVNMPATWELTAAQVWDAVLKELELEVTRATFDTWLRGARLVAYDADGGLFTVAVGNGYAADWLTHRLDPAIRRALARVAGRPVDVRFVVEEEAWPETETSSS
ncbi:MAG: hypothetical protein JXM73_12075 [Anaerolineae bacterium]|nr:hypothetical protein [Anaerolineae bacterium]